jgi:hypothetical protein
MDLAPNHIKKIKLTTKTLNNIFIIGLYFKLLSPTECKKLRGIKTNKEHSINVTPFYLFGIALKIA